MKAAGIRSLLFVPGDSENKILKALASDADAVILDLEDAVAVDQKPKARELTCRMLEEAPRNGKPVLVRVNASDTGMTPGDLAAVLRGGPWGIVLPKCSGPADIRQLSLYLDVLETREGIATGATRILTVSTETAAATLALGQPGAGVSPRLWGLLWGGEDLSASLGVTRNRDDAGAYTFPFQFARSQTLFAANALGAEPVDAVYANFRDIAGLERETRDALRDGFTAKAAIHPSQVEVINQLLTPSAEQVDWAQQVVALLAETGVARLNGGMVDLAHKRIAERLLDRANVLGSHP